MEPTGEQQAARDVFASGRDLALVAGAGTGKTSTLVLMGAATRRRDLYMVFGRDIAADARRRFGANVDCRTSHSLAYRAGGHAYQLRLDRAAHIPSKETARLLGIDRDLGIDSHRITRSHQARLVMGMIRRFCYSTDRILMARHMERVNGLHGPAQDFLARVLLPYAIRAWADLRSFKGRLKFTPDHYMKMWAMTKPVLPADFILLDEAQDTNPVLEEVFLAQDAQRVCSRPGSSMNVSSSAGAALESCTSAVATVTSRSRPSVSDLRRRERRAAATEADEGEWWYGRHRSNSGRSRSLTTLTFGTSAPSPQHPSHPRRQGPAGCASKLRGSVG
ncbi:MAG: helicase [Streptosporangiaceae bacterium]|nr:helicase [Streptosporangiaceae bacterium]